MEIFWSALILFTFELMIDKCANVPVATYFFDLYFYGDLHLPIHAENKFFFFFKQ